LRCDDIIRRLTAYVDGELDDATGSALRGHLRTCATCHAAAEDEVAVRDAMAKLPTPDVPAELWRSIQTQLAEREVADSKRSRAWLWWQVVRPKLIPSLLFAGAATLAVVAYVRHGHTASEPAPQTAHATAPGSAHATSPAPPIGPTPIATTHIKDPLAPPSVDADCDLHAVTAGARATLGEETDTARVAGMAEAIDRCYSAAAAELLAMVAEDRPAWSKDRAASFDAELDTARHAVTTAPAGRPRERAWQAVIQLLQRAVTVQMIAEVTR
jgi:anti-sigma factor (TIGR02949 family)